MLAGLAIWITAISIATAALYAWDKRAAIRGQPRIRESTLLACAVAGGWPGGVVAGQFLRHKTQKLPYRVKFAVCIALNAVVVVGLLIGGW